MHAFHILVLIGKPSLTVQADEVQFRQSPTLEDCFPGSVKMYRDVQVNDEVLKVLRT